jgi:hypothetical protein
MVVLQFRDFSLVVTKPGDERWTTLHANCRISSSLPFAGRFYCATSGGISVLDTTVEAGADRRLPSGMCFVRQGVPTGH